MNCKKIVSLLSAYVDGELPGNDMLIIRNHLSECESCAKEHASIRQTKHMLSRLKTASPRAELVGTIISNLDSAPQQGLRSFFSYHIQPIKSSVLRTSLAAALGCVILIAIFITPHTSHNANQNDSMIASDPTRLSSYEKMTTVPGIPYCVSICAARSKAHKMPNLPNMPYADNGQSFRVMDKTQFNENPNALSIAAPQY